jgi:Ca2+-binding RTX toxin-like protein
LSLATGGGSVYQELGPLLELFDAEVPLSGVLVPAAASLPAEFGIGSTGGRATFGRLFDDGFARDDFYRHLPGTLEASFDTTVDSFTYNDDSFRATAAPGYADGGYIGAGGFSGGALRVFLGGLDNVAVLGMSGGWERQITLTEASEVSVTFRYQLTHSGHHEIDEYAEVMMSVDGVLYGSGANDYVARITGDGDGGPDLTTGWQSFTIDVGVLAAGTHSVVIGGYANKKTFNDEFAEVLIDDVTITDSGPLIVGQAEGLLANDFTLGGLSLTVGLAAAPSHGTLSHFADGSFIYTPAANFLGVDEFSYRADNGILSDSGRVVIEVGNVIRGTAAAESLTGTSARDALLAAGGDDTLSGGDGDDRLTGGSGADLLTGGDGADIFAYDSGDGGAVLALADTITDFVDGTDLIGLTGSLVGLSIGGGGLTVTDDGGGNAVVTVVSSGEVLTVVTGAFGLISDADFVDL